jgi:hypothetical protein
LSKIKINYRDLHLVNEKATVTCLLFCTKTLAIQYTELFKTSAVVTFAEIQHRFSCTQSAVTKLVSK